MWAACIAPDSSHLPQMNACVFAPALSLQTGQDTGLPLFESVKMHQILHCI